MGNLCYRSDMNCRGTHNTLGPVPGTGPKVWNVAKFIVRVMAFGPVQQCCKRLNHTWDYLSYKYLIRIFTNNTNRVSIKKNSATELSILGRTKT